MSLEEKRRLAQQSEAMKRIQEQPQLLPNNTMTSKTVKSPTQDLTSTLMERNLNQMNFGSLQSPKPATTAGTTTADWGSFGSGGFQAMNTSHQQSSMAGTSKPDLSAFDSLLAMPSRDQTKKPSLNKMSHVASNQQSASFMVPSPAASGEQASAQSNQTVRNLSASDINDLLG